MSIEEEIADEIAGIVTGDGYYATTIGIDAAREAVEAITPLLNRVRAEAWERGVDAAQRSYECDYYDPWKRLGENPYVEQNSEGNET